MGIGPRPPRDLAAVALLHAQPFVERVIFVATPRRGSYLAGWRPGQLGSWLIRETLRLSKRTVGAVTQSEEAQVMRVMDQVPTAIDDMSPSNPFIATRSLRRSSPTCRYGPLHVEVVPMVNTPRADCIDEGQGEIVILVHSSVSGNRQWRALIDALRDRYRVLAVNLFGYGQTPPWPSHEAQTLEDQARLVLAAGQPLPVPVHIVGHSFGGSVALKAAALLGPSLGRLVLLEPNPFYLLKQQGRTEAYEEACELRDHVKRFGGRGDWLSVAARFADYWVGDGAWAAMPDKRRAAFAESLPPNFHEWDAVMTEETPVCEWAALSGRTLLVISAQPRRPIREIAELFREACPHWTFVQLAEGGHMAPLTHPETINSITRRFLDGGVGAA